MDPWEVAVISILSVLCVMIIIWCLCYDYIADWFIWLERTCCTRPHEETREETTTIRF